MKLKTAKIVFFIGCGLMILFLLLCSALQKRVYGYIGAAFAFASAVFWLVFGRCPACGQYLGRVGKGQHCPHCGEKIEE